MAQQYPLMLLGNIGENRVFAKLRDAEVRVWLAEIFLLYEDKKMVRIADKDEAEVSDVVNDLEEQLNEVKKLAGLAFKAFRRVNKVGREGNFTKELQDEAFEEESKLDEELKNLREELSWYKEETVNILTDRNSSQ